MLNTTNMTNISSINSILVYSQHCATDHLRIKTICLKRPPKWSNVRPLWMHLNLSTMTIYQQWPPVNKNDMLKITCQQWPLIDILVGGDHYRLVCLYDTKNYKIEIFKQVNVKCISYVMTLCCFYPRRTQFTIAVITVVIVLAPEIITLILNS